MTDRLSLKARLFTRPTALEAKDTKPKAPTADTARPLSRIRDGFETAKANKVDLAGGPQVQLLQATGTSASARGQGLSETDRERAREIAEDVASGGSPQQIVDFLEAHPDPKAQADFWSELTANEDVAHFAFNRLDFIDDPAAQRLLGESLKHALDAGVISPSDFGPDGALSGGSVNETHESLASVLAATGNEEAILAFVEAELEIVGMDERFTGRSGAAAIALGGLSPAQFQEFLENNPEAVQTILEHQPPDNTTSIYPPDENPALGIMLERALLVNPPTPETVKFFTDALPKVGENSFARSAAAQFFIQNHEALMQQGPAGVGFIGPNGAILPDKQQVLSELFAVTLFTEPRAGNAAALETVISEQLAAVQERLNAAGDADPGDLTNAAVEDARLMGSLVGTLEAGFQVAVDRIEDKNAAVDGAASLFKKIGGLIPDLPIPGAGLIKDMTIDQLVDYFADRAKENPRNEEEAIPFHQIFGASLTNGTLASAYDSARAEAFLNNQLGLTNPDND